MNLMSIFCALAVNLGGSVEPDVVDAKMPRSAVLQDPPQRGYLAPGTLAITNVNVIPDDRRVIA